MGPVRGLSSSGFVVAHTLQHPSSSGGESGFLMSCHSMSGLSISAAMRGRSNTSEKGGKPPVQETWEGAKGGMTPVRFDRYATYSILTMVIKSFAEHEHRQLMVASNSIVEDTYSSLR